METIVGAVVAAVIGSAFTAAATWWVSSRLDRQRSHRELYGAIGVVATELEENSGRIEDNADDETLRSDLTLGDWQSSKSAFAGLALRPNRADLWKAVTNAYGEISDFKFGSRGRRPSAVGLHTLSSRLLEEQGNLEGELKAFSRPKWMRRSR